MPKHSGLIVYPQKDKNGAFLNDSHITERLVVELGSDLHEAGNLFGLGRAMIRHQRRYGAMDYMVLGGHGSSDSIRLGDAELSLSPDLTTDAIRRSESFRREDRKWLDAIFKKSASRGSWCPAPRESSWMTASPQSQRR